MLNISFVNARLKLILKNFSYLSLLQGINLIIPMLLYPYLIKIISPEIYGKVIYAQTFVVILGGVVDFGFSAIGPREVSILRKNKLLLAQFSYSVIIIKVFISIVIFSGLILWTLFSSSNFDKLLLYLSFIPLINEVIFCKWFFQGIENMKYIAYISGTSKVLTFVLTICLVNAPSDYLFVPLIRGVLILSSGVYSLHILKKSLSTGFFIPPIRMIIKTMKDACPYLISNMAIVVRDQFNVIFIGSFLSNVDVALYDLCKKIINFIKVPFSMFKDSMFPSLAGTKSKREFLFYFIGALLVSLTVVVFVFFTIPFLISLVKGITSDSAIFLVRLNSIVIPINVMSMFLGSYLIIFKGAKKYLLTVILSVITYLLSLLLIYYFNLVTVVNVILITIIAAVVELVFRFIYKD